MKTGTTISFITLIAVIIVNAIDFITNHGMINWSSYSMIYCCLTIVFSYLASGKKNADEIK